ncbi:MAG: hypothetical protein ABIG66_04690 [Candidatus Kerfeldbacteria bacterium]
MPNKQTKKMTKKQWSFDVMMVPYILIVLTVILVGASLSMQKLQFEKTTPKNTFQAVFLVNGQVYFGHLDSLSRNYFQLTDVYYLQQQEQLTDDAKNGEKETSIKVIRLGEEIHQPENTIVIRKEHVLFWENLRTDSQIIDAINQY